MAIREVCSIVLFCAVAVFGRPSDMTEAEFTNLQFTVEKLNQILKAYEPYKEYMPAYAWDKVEKATDEQKNQMVQMVNDYHAGQFEPKNFQELIAVIKDKYPALASDYQEVYDKYQEQVATLGPKGQEFSKNMEAQMYSDASPDRIIWTCNIFNHAQSSINQAKALLLDDSEAPQIQKTFPEIVKFMESKEFEAYVIIVNNLKPLDCTKDREQVFNTLKLFDMKKVVTTN